MYFIESCRKKQKNSSTNLHKKIKIWQQIFLGQKINVDQVQFKLKINHCYRDRFSFYVMLLNAHNLTIGTTNGEFL